MLYLGQFDRLPSSCFVTLISGAFTKLSATRNNVKIRSIKYKTVITDIPTTRVRCQFAMKPITMAIPRTAITTI